MGPMRSLQSQYNLRSFFLRRERQREPSGTSTSVSANRYLPAPPCRWAGWWLRPVAGLHFWAGVLVEQRLSTRTLLPDSLRALSRLYTGQLAVQRVDLLS